MILAAIILFILFSLANLRYLPVIDFLPYKKGVKIADKMVIPDGVPADQYKTTFIYEKNGIKKEFNLSITILQMIPPGSLWNRNQFL